MAYFRLLLHIKPSIDQSVAAQIKSVDMVGDKPKIPFHPWASIDMFNLDR